MRFKRAAKSTPRVRLDKIKLTRLGVGIELLWVLCLQNLQLFLLGQVVGRGHAGFGHSGF
jgi:hypothetical protein